MNKKGFTLVELLAVIIIISLLALLTTTSVTKLVKDAKNDLSSVQIASIKSAAESWGADNLDKLPEDGECKYLTLKDLKDYGLLDTNIIDPKNNKTISDNLKIKITSSIGSSNRLITNYEVNPESLEGCSKVIEYICTFLDSEYGEKEKIGSHYKCNVNTPDPATTFYILEVKDNKVSLIMDRNFTDGTIPKIVAWCTDGGYDNTTCTNINDTYIPHIQEEFKKSGSTVTVSFPSVEQVASADGKNYLNRPKLSKTWLYDYLSGTMHPVSGVYGYWTSSPDADNSAYAWIVSHDSYLCDYGVNNGVRPVITLNKNQLN